MSDTVTMPRWAYIFVLAALIASALASCISIAATLHRARYTTYPIKVTCPDGYVVKFNSRLADLEKHTAHACDSHEKRTIA